MLGLRGERVRLQVVTTDFNQGEHQVALKGGIIIHWLGEGKLDWVPIAQEKAYMKTIPKVPMNYGMVLRVLVSEELQAL